MAAWPQLHAGDVGLHAGVPLGPGQRRGVAGLSGQAFPALGELDVFAFAAAGFLADAFVDLDAVAAGTTERAGWTLEVGIAAPTVLDSRPARTPRTGSVRPQIVH